MNMNTLIIELLIVVLSLMLFIFLQRWFHRLFQAVIMLITHDQTVSISIFSLIFLPGVVIHELSHFLMAKLLRVKTGKISLIPKVLDQKRVQLGYVEIYPTDLFRDALIGLAPLLSGIVLVNFIANRFLNIPSLDGLVSSVSIAGLVSSLFVVIGSEDALIWLYLTFAISTAMMPSESDRKAWLLVAMLFAILILAAFGAGYGEWITKTLESPFRRSLVLLTFNLWISAILHAISVFILLIIHFFLTKILQLTYAKQSGRN